MATPRCRCLILVPGPKPSLGPWQFQPWIWLCLTSGRSLNGVHDRQQLCSQESDKLCLTGLTVPPTKPYHPTPTPPQVTSGGVRLVDCVSETLVGMWTPPAGFSINVAAGSPTQVRAGLVVSTKSQAHLCRLCPSKYQHDVLRTKKSPEGARTWSRTGGFCHLAGMASRGVIGNNNTNVLMLLQVFVQDQRFKRSGSGSSRGQGPKPPPASPSITQGLCCMQRRERAFVLVPFCVGARFCPTGCMLMLFALHRHAPSLFGWSLAVQSTEHHRTFGQIKAPVNLPLLWIQTVSAHAFSHALLSPYQGFGCEQTGFRACN